MEADAESVELSFSMSGADLRHGARARRRSSAMWPIIRVLLVTCAVLLVLSLLVWFGLAFMGELEPEDWIPMAAIPVGACVIGLLDLYVRRYWAQLAARLGNVHASIDDQCVRMTNDSTSSISEWSAYGSYVETRQAFVLFSPDRRRMLFTVLPKHGIAHPSDADRLRRILERNVGRPGSDRPRQD